MRSEPGSRPDPAEIGQRMAAGDRGAAYEAFDEFDVYLNRHLIQAFGSHLSASDRDKAIARVLARLVHRPALFRPGNRSLKGFLILCVNREARKIAGAHGRWRRAWEMIPGGLAADRFRGDGAPPYARVMAEERSRQLSSLIDRLSPDYQEVVRCYLEHGNEYSSVLAAKRDERKETIQTRLTRARQELRRLAGNLEQARGGA